MDSARPPGSTPESNSGVKSARWRRVGSVACLLSALLPAVICLMLVDRHAGHTPMWDEWERGPLLQKYAAGELTWSDLTGGHINHRILTQRLLVLAGTKLWPGNLRAEQFCIVGLLIVAALGLAWLVHRSGAGPFGKWLALFSMSMLLFSPMQFQNLLWAIQFAFVFPIPMLVLAAILVVPSKRWQDTTCPEDRAPSGVLPGWWWFRVVLAAGCCWLATYSFAHGLLTWAAILPLVAYVAAGGRWAGWRRGLAWGGGWAALTALVWWRYFTNLVTMSHPAHSYFTPTGQKAPGVMSLKEFLAHPWEVLATGVTMLGAPLARLPGMDPRDVGLWLGLAFLIIAILLTTAWFYASPWRKQRALPFLALLAFGCAAVVAVSVSRTTVIDITWVAVKSRYVTLATTAWIGAIGMLLVLCGRCPFARDNAAETGGLSAFARWLPLSTALAGVLLAHSFHQWMIGIQLMDHWRTTRQQAKSALMHLDFTDISDIHRIDADQAFIRKHANFLIDKGWLRARIFDRMEIGNFRMRSDLNNRRGDWLTVRVDDEGNLDVQGFASLPPDARPAHGVYLVWQPQGVSWDQAEVLTYAAVGGMPKVVLTRSDYEYSGAQMPEAGLNCRWRAEIPVASLGSGPGRLAVMALDVDQMQARRLATHFFIDPATLYPGADLLEELGEESEAGAPGCR